MEKQPCVYIMTNKRQGTLYVGITSNILRRTWQHRTGQIPGFTKKYQLHMLVFFEFLASFPDAIKREKQIKHWKRRWKIGLIEKENPEWEDLYRRIV